MAIYDLDELRAIPVSSVCENFGVRPTKMKNMYYSPSGEKDGSLYLYETKNQNRFYDFGRCIGGDSIQLVAYICGLEWKDAVEELASAFGIQPLSKDQKDSPFELSNHQWNKIGIFGDLATKNFEYSFSGKHPIKRWEAICEKYNMTMNELRKKNPGVYKKTLKNKAFSYVYACQQQYFHALSSEYIGMKIGGFENFDKMTNSGQEQIKKILDDLKTTERILKLALKGTNLEFTFYPYDMEKDFKRIVDGDIELEVGSISSYSLNLAAEEKNLKLAEKELDLNIFEEIKKLDFTISYSAIQKKDRVLVTAEKKNICLFENMEKLLLYGLEVDEKRENPLNEKISDAKNEIDIKNKTKETSKTVER